MTKIPAAAVIIALIGGCKAKDSDWRAEADQLDRIMVNMSDCTEKACGDEVHQKLEAWRKDVDAKHGKDAALPHDVQVLYDDVVKREAKIADRSVVAEMTKERDSGCSCKDGNCVRGVLAGAAAIKTRAESRGFPPNTISDEDRRKVEDLYQQLVACSSKVIGVTTP